VLGQFPLVENTPQAGTTLSPPQPDLLKKLETKKYLLPVTVESAHEPFPGSGEITIPSPAEARAMT